MSDNRKRIGTVSYRGANSFEAKRLDRYVADRAAGNGALPSGYSGGSYGSSPVFAPVGSFAPILKSAMYVGLGGSISAGASADADFTSGTQMSDGGNTINMNSYILIERTGSWLLTCRGLVYRPSSTNQTLATVLAGLDAGASNYTGQYNAFWETGRATADQRVVNISFITYFAIGDHVTVNYSVGATSPSTIFGPFNLTLTYLASQIDLFA